MDLRALKTCRDQIPRLARLERHISGAVLVGQTERGEVVVFTDELEVRARFQLAGGGFGRVATNGRDRVGLFLQDRVELRDLEGELIAHFPVARSTTSSRALSRGSTGFWAMYEGGRS